MYYSEWIIIVFGRAKGQWVRSPSIHPVYLQNVSVGGEHIICLCRELHTMQKPTEGRPMAVVRKLVYRR